MEVTYEGRDIEAMFFAPNYYRWIHNEFKPFLEGKVLEVGAGSGTFSALLLDCPVSEIVALEPSKKMFPILEKRFHDTARVACRQTTLPAVSAEYRDSFDAVVYVNVLEHVADDAAELSQVHAALRGDGTLCIFAPALPWLMSDYDRSIGHYRRYYKKELRLLLEKTGFEVVSLRYFDIVGIVPWLIFVKLLRRPLTGGSVALYDSTILPIMRWLESLIPLPLGKNLIVVARKRR